MMATIESRSPSPWVDAWPTTPAMPTGPDTCERLAEKVKTPKKKCARPTAVSVIIFQVICAPWMIDCQSESGTTPTGAISMPIAARDGSLGTRPATGRAKNVFVVPSGSRTESATVVLPPPSATKAVKASGSAPEKA